MPPLRSGICSIVVACLWHAIYHIARSTATIEEYSVTQWRSFFHNSSLLIPHCSLFSHRSCVNLAAASSLILYLSIFPAAFMGKAGMNQT